MARHWSEYARPGLTSRQVQVLDRWADGLDIGDGLDLLALANGLSRSKAARQVANRFAAQRMMDAAVQLVREREGGAE